MNEPRRQVLELLAAGQVTVDEAEQLFTALGREQPASGTGEAAPATSGPTQPRYLRVVIESAEHFGGDGPGRVNVKIPMALLRAGVRMTSLLPPSAVQMANEAMRHKGIPFDLGQLRPQHLDALLAQLDEETVLVDQPDLKVRIASE